MKKTTIFMVLFGVFSLCLLAFSSENSEYPRHRCSSIREVSTRIGFPIAMPDFLSDLDSRQYRIKYYATAVPAEKSIIKTGYSILVKYIGSEQKAFRQIEFRGIDLSKAGTVTENLAAEGDACTIPVTTIKSYGKELTYSAYNLISYASQHEIPYFQTFYVYCMSGNIRYSISFSDFTSPTDKHTAEICLEQANIYFRQYL